MNKRLVKRSRQRRFRMTPEARAREIALLETDSPGSVPLLKELGAEFRRACEEFSKPSSLLP